MVKRKINPELKKKLGTYLARVSKVYEIDKAFLFGSTARGEAGEFSDIDVAIVSNNITNRFLDGAKMASLTYGIDTRIEPHAIRTSEFLNKEIPIVDEILKYGVRL